MNARMTPRVLVGVVVAACLGCGARTGLLVPDPIDASIDSIVDGADVADAFDAIDVVDAEVAADALPDVVPLDRCPRTGIVALVEGESLPQDFSVGATSLFWITDETDALVGKVRTAGKGGGPVTTLAALEIDPEAIWIDATRVYWWAGEGLNRVHFTPFGGGDVVELPTIISPASSPSVIAVDDTFVYFNDVGVRAVPKGGGLARDIENRGSVLELVTDSSGAFWTGHVRTTDTPYAVRHYDPAADRVTILGNPPYISNDRFTLAVDAEWIWFADHAGIARMPRAGGDAVSFLPTKRPVTAIALDDKNVFFMEGGYDHDTASISVVSRTGGVPKPIAESRTPSRLVVDTRCVYWLDGLDLHDGRIMSAPS
jgi:hypothetical protein